MPSADRNLVATRLEGEGRALADLPGIVGGTRFAGSAVSFARFNEAGQVAEEWVFPGETKPLEG